MMPANEPNTAPSVNNQNDSNGPIAAPMPNNMVDKKNDGGQTPATDDTSTLATDTSKSQATLHAPSRIALAQMCSGKNPKKNIATIIKFIKHAKAKKAQLVAFPEVCNIMERDKNKAWDVLFHEESDSNLTTIKDLAKEIGIWVLLGSYLVKATNPDNDNNEEKKFYNRSLLISDKGEVAARYDKIHLFDMNLANGESYNESASVVAGGSIVTCDGPFDSDQFGRLGLSVCYDVRFPYLYRKLNHLGAGIIFVPAAFTVTTGLAHWHSLLRARAIENACWIIAPAQVGNHPDGRKTFGHSMVIDPWGKIVIEAKNKFFSKNQLLVVELDPMAMNDARTQIHAYRPYLDYSLS